MACAEGACKIVIKQVGCILHVPAMQHPVSVKHSIVTQGLQLYAMA